MSAMAEAGVHSGDRQWFDDERRAGRRLGVTSHPDHGLVVLSMWSGETCTATFRMPMTDAARMIGALADGMAGGLVTADVPTAVAVRPWWARLADRFRRPRKPPPDDPTTPGPHLTLVR
jgi:hypothetical protein